MFDYLKRFSLVLNLPETAANNGTIHTLIDRRESQPNIAAPSRRVLADSPWVGSTAGYFSRQLHCCCLTMLENGDRLLLYDVYT